MSLFLCRPYTNGFALRLNEAGGVVVRIVLRRVTPPLGTIFDGRVKKRDSRAGTETHHALQTSDEYSVARLEVFQSRENEQAAYDKQIYQKVLHV